MTSLPLLGCLSIAILVLAPLPYVRDGLLMLLHRMLQALVLVGLALCISLICKPSWISEFNRALDPLLASLGVTTDLPRSTPEHWASLGILILLGVPVVLLLELLRGFRRHFQLLKAIRAELQASRFELEALSADRQNAPERMPSPTRGMQRSIDSMRSFLRGPGSRSAPSRPLREYL